ncbi:MAG: hypothetical protein ACI86M_001357 [Saprospiraceae bacterium]|jgi:hypothetical protein
MIDISFKNRTGLKPDILSAVIGADSFFYGLFTGDGQLLESNHYSLDSFDDESIIEKIKFDIYSTAGLTVKVAYSGKPYLHNEKSTSGSLTRFFPAFANKDFNADKLTDQEVVVDYGFTKAHSTFLNEVLGRIDVKFHLSTVLANYYYPYTASKLIACVDDSKLHVMYAKDRKFLFYNQFDCVHENDYLYFIKLVYKEMKLNPESSPLELAGKLDIESPIYKLLKDYIRNIDFMQSSVLDVKDLNYKAKQHYYLDLFATSICA